MRWFLIIVLFIVINTVCAQVEHIGNGSFEELTSCQVGGSISSIDFANGWTNALEIYYSTPDVFNSCINPFFVELGVPDNWAGHHVPVNGQGYAGIAIYVGNNFREIIQSKLIKPLVTGKKYVISFYISYGINYSYKSSNLCFALTEEKPEAGNETDITTGNYFPGLSTADIIVFDNLLMADTLDWTYFTKEFTANSPAMYITIGNLSPNSQTILEYAWPSTFGSNFWTSYILIDDISLFCMDTANCDGSVGLEPLKDMRLSVYPNPFTNGFTLTLPVNEATSIKIIELAGRLVDERTIFNFPEFISTTELRPGIYFIQARDSSGKLMMNEKIIKQQE